MGKKERGKGVREIEAWEEEWGEGEESERGRGYGERDVVACGGKETV